MCCVSCVSTDVSEMDKKESYYSIVHVKIITSRFQVPQKFKINRTSVIFIGFAQTSSPGLIYKEVSKMYLNVIGCIVRPKRRFEFASSSVNI